MQKIPHDMYYGAIYETKNYGFLKVIKYIDSKHVLVEFIDTGYRTEATARFIRIGSVKDKLYPNVYGVGCIGDGIFDSKSNGKQTEAYRCWNSVMERCYSEKYHLKKPTYKSCEVCEEWQNFQNFAEWFYENKPTHGDFELDKDIKSGHLDLYSPETCMFVTKYDNVMEMVNRRFKS